MASSASAPSAIPVVLMLAALLAAYAITSITPGMWLWGVEIGEFLPASIAVVAASLWGLAVVAAMIEAASAVAGKLAPAASPARVDDGAGPRSQLPWAIGGAALMAIAAAALCTLLPDRANFTGDLLLRKGLIASAVDPRTIVSQAMPADRALFIDLPRLLVARAGLDPYLAARLLGALEAAALGVIGWAFARSLKLGSGATLAVAAIATFQPLLALCTGYAKPLGAEALLAAAVLALALSVARGGRGLLPLALATCAALSLHRSGLALLPVWMLACAREWRSAGTRGQAPGVGFWLALALPPITLAFTLPDMLAAFRTVDTQHLGAATGGGLAGLARLASWLDRLNVLLVVAPLAPLALALAPSLPDDRDRRGEWWMLSAALVPQLMLLLLVHPRQGWFRDWDVFAAAGAVATFATAWLAGEALRAPRRAALATALATTAIATTVGWLALWNHPRLAGARIESWLAGPPEPEPVGAASAWSFLAQHRAKAADWAGAEDAYARAATLAPNPRTIVEWGMAEALRGDQARAVELYSRAAALDSNLTNAWLGLAASASWLDRVDDVRRARRELQRLAPGHPRLADIESYLSRAEQADPSPAGPPRAATSSHAIRPRPAHRVVARAQMDSSGANELEYRPAVATSGHGGTNQPEGVNPPR